LALSQGEYDERRPPGAPCARTLVRWSRRPWSELCAAAGKTAGGASPVPWAPAAKIAAVRAAASAVVLDRGELLTLQRYHDWRTAQDAPSRYPSALAFGDVSEWLEWCRQAGVKSGRKRRRYRHRDLQILEHLIAAGAGSGSLRSTTYEQYREAHPEAPVRATIIDRFGTWREAVAAATALAERRGGQGQLRSSGVPSDQGAPRPRRDSTAGGRPPRSAKRV
jgi:hypothetical protein